MQTYFHWWTSCGHLNDITGYHSNDATEKGPFVIRFMT